jgi:small conductance mechanosensitive channel
MADSLAILITIVVAFVAAFALVRAARAIVDQLLNALDIVGTEQRAAMHARALQLVRALRFLAYGVAALASISLALSRFGVSEARLDPRTILRWAVVHGINVVIIIAGAFITMRAASFAIEHLQYKLARRHATTDLEWQRRATTLGGILTSLVSAAVGFVAILMLLRELAIDVVPILTGAGIVGLAVGFGAQNLVRDVISGFFLILEDQVRIGDLARINGVQGTVEQINLRTIMMRDGEGAVQVFPNGTITALANLSKQFAYASVEVKVAYTENMERVMGTMREVGAAMQQDTTWSGVVLEPLLVLGLVSIADGMATIGVKFKTLPLNQGKVANELRRRLLYAFVARGIKPFV